MFIGENFHVAMGRTNVIKEGLSNIGSAHSNMKILANKRIAFYSLLHCFLDKFEFIEMFDTKVELIYGRLLPWYEDNDMVVTSLCFIMTC